MRFKYVVLVVLFLFLWGSVASNATLTPISAPSGTIRAGFNRLTVSGIPYDPTTQLVFAGIPLGGNLSRYVAPTQTTLFYDNLSPSAFGNVVPGDGYGLQASQVYPLSFPGFNFPAGTDAWITLGAPLGSAWIGNPLGTDVLWNNVCVTNGQVVYSMSDPNADTLVSPSFFDWDNLTQSQFESAPDRRFAYDNQFRSWHGYIAAQSNGDQIALIVPGNGLPLSPDANNSVAYAKLQDGTGIYVTVNDCFVTYAGSEFAYVEQPNRGVGIRVEGLGPGVLSAGTRFDSVAGFTGVNADGEKCINMDSVGAGVTGSVAPVGMCNRSVGGRDWYYNSLTGAGQQGVTGGYGLNNIGLLVSTWGKFTRLDDSSFTVDDGTGSPVKCVLQSGVRLPDTRGWKYLNVTGVVSCYRDSAGNVKPQILSTNDVPDSQILYQETPTYTAQVTIGSSTSKTMNPLVSGYGLTYYDGNDVLKDRVYNSADRTVTSGTHVTDSFKSYVQALKPALIRYPSWTMDDYHWRDGVGPMSKRCRLNWWWDPWRVPLFGTDELMIFCYDIDSTNRPEPIMGVNTLQLDSHDTEHAGARKGLGNILSGLDSGEIFKASTQEAANWVEYCNAGVTDSVTRTCAVHSATETHTVLEWAAEENWEPSLFVPSSQQYSSNPTEVTDQRCDAVEWAGTRNIGGTNYRSWLSYATRNSEPTPALNPAPPSGYYNCPVGYFGWLRRYFAWQRAGSPVDGGGQPTWKNLSLFTEASYHAPYNIKYWEMGNEVFCNYQNSSMPGYTNLTGTTYAQMVHSYSDLMKARSPSTIEIGASVVGRRLFTSDTTTYNWDSAFVSACDPSEIDFVAPHYYSGFGGTYPYSLVMEKYVRGPYSDRTLDLPAAGEYQFKVVARAMIPLTSGSRPILETEDPARFELRLIHSGSPDIVGEARFRSTQPVEPIEQTQPDLIVTMTVPYSGTCTLRMTDLLKHLDDVTYYDTTVYLYKVYMKRPGSSRWESVLFPEDAEQQLLASDYNIITRNIANPNKTVPETDDGYWGIKDRLTAANKDLDIIVTEGNLGYSEIYPNDDYYPTMEGYPSRQVAHQFRYKAAFWFTTMLKALNDNDITGYTMHDLMDGGDWGLIRDPLAGATSYPASTNVNISTVTPSYRLMTLWAKLLGGTIYNVNLGTTPTFSFPSSLPAPARFNYYDNVWHDWFCMKPQNVPYLDAIACAKTGENKLYLLVTNRKNEKASTTINLGSFSVQSTASVSTLSVQSLVHTTQAFAAWNSDPILEAFSESHIPGVSGEIDHDTIGITSSTMSNASSSFTYTFEPYTFTLFEFTTL